MNCSRMLTLALAALLACGALFAAAPVRAATFTVTRNDDPLPNGCQPSDCSLREAIMEANVSAGPDTITLLADTFTLSIPNASFLSSDDEDAAATGDLDVAGNITLTGAGAATTIIQAGTTSDNGIDRVFEVLPSGTLSLSGVTVQHGQVKGFSKGGGIYSHGTLTLVDSIISDNTGERYGGGIHNDSRLTIINSTISGNKANYGGGIGNDGTLTITKSTISGNTADSDGGGIDNGGTLTLTDSTISGNTATQYNGGGICNTGTLTITTSAVSGNTAGSDAGGIRNSEDSTLMITNSTISDNTAARYEGGGIENLGPLTLTNSTVSGNTAGSDAGGIRNSSPLTITNSTISGNTSARYGGGIYNHYDTLTLTNSTITNNIADSNNDGTGIGGGVFNNNQYATTTLKNTLIGDNTRGTGTTKDDCAGTLASQGYNLIESTAGCTITGDTTGNLIDTDPQLGPLQDNGGSTQTHALQPPFQGPVFGFVGSPAINAGNPAGCTDAAGQPLATDQRGVARPQGARCDIGAFELEMAAPPTPTPSPSPTPSPEPSPMPSAEPSPAPSPEPVPSSIRVFLPLTTK